MKVPRISAEEVLQAGADLGESPVWDDRSQRLVWVDITRGIVHEFDPRSGVDTPASVGIQVGAAALRASGGLVLAVRNGFAAWQHGTAERLGSIDPGAPDIRMNDGKVDPAGRFWAGTMADDERRGAGALFRLDPDHSVQRVLTGLTISNGLDWSLDATRMFFIDSTSGGIDTFDYELETGNIAKRRRVVEIPARLGLPDGMTMDSDDCLWVAIWGSGQVRRFSPAGRLIGVVNVAAENVTSCAFGGAGLEDLYITSAASDSGSQDRNRGNQVGGSLYACRPGTTGRPAHRFLG